VTGPGVNSTAASLLGFLHDGPKTGWELVATAERLIGPFWSLTRSQVYRELNVMAEQGLVLPGPVGRRDARPYTISDAGRQAFAQWAARGPDAAGMRLPLLLFTVLGRHIPGDRLAEVMREQRRHQAATLKEYLRAREALRAGGADVFALSTLEYGIAAARMTLRWLDGLPAEVTGERPGRGDTVAKGSRRKPSDDHGPDDPADR
jgi:DNA-binding PadR family transcriptional regulator